MVVGLLVSYVAELASVVACGSPYGFLPALSSTVATRCMWLFKGKLINIPFQNQVLTMLATCQELKSHMWSMATT